MTTNSTGDGLDVVENGRLSLDSEQTLLVHISRGENYVLFAQDLVVIDDMWVFAFLEDKSVVPQLDEIEYFRLDAGPILGIGAEVFY